MKKEPDKSEKCRASLSRLEVDWPGHSVNFVPRFQVPHEESR